MPENEQRGASEGVAAPGPLAAKLAAIMPGFLAINPPGYILDAMKSGKEWLESSDVLDRAIRKGEHIPDFELPGVHQTTVSSHDLIQPGGAVIVFFRGIWCNPCKMQLAALQDIYPEITRHGVKLAAISPQLPEFCRETVQTLGLSFEVLSDRGNLVAERFGIRYRVPDDLAAVYRDYFKVDLAKYNGDDSQTLALTPTWIVSPAGVIEYVDLQGDYFTRMEPSQIVAFLASRRESRHSA